MVCRIGNKGEGAAWQPRSVSQLFIICGVRRTTQDIRIDRGSSARLGTSRITKISYGVGVPLDRLNVMVNDLCSSGPARKTADDGGPSYSVTPRGSEFLDTYWKMKGFLEIMGDGY